MKFEFGDIYKYFVSLGTVLISMALLVPWLFLREPFDLLTPTEKIKAATEIAQAIIEKRQATVAIIMSILPIFSLITFALGFCLFFHGIKNWGRKQKELDKLAQIELAAKTVAANRPLTEDEQEVEKNAEGETPTSPNDATSITQNNKASHENNLGLRFETDFNPAGIQTTGKFRTDDDLPVAMVERFVFRRLRDCIKDKYQIESNAMVGGIDIDILLTTKSKFTSDCLIEVKVIRKGFNSGWLKETFLRCLYAQNLYSQLTDRSPDSLLLIVMDKNAAITEKYKKLVANVSQDKFAVSGKNRIVLISSDDIKELPADALCHRLGL